MDVHPLGRFCLQQSFTEPFDALMVTGKVHVFCSVLIYLPETWRPFFFFKGIRLLKVNRQDNKVS
jgi:hypothetical protein